MFDIAVLYCTGCFFRLNKVIRFDDDTRKPCVGACGHSICSLCVEWTDDGECPICRSESSFNEKSVNYDYLRIMEEYERNYWQVLKNLLRSESTNIGSCSRCLGESAYLRICLICDGLELCREDHSGCRLRMFSITDLLHLVTRVLCSDCFFVDHEGHKNIILKDIKLAREDMKMVTAKTILELFHDQMVKNSEDGGLWFLPYLKQTENAEISFSELLLPREHTSFGECGSLSEQIKLALIDKSIDVIDEKLELEKSKSEAVQHHNTTVNSKSQETNCLTVYESWWRSEMFELHSMCLECLRKLYKSAVGVSCHQKKEREFESNLFSVSQFERIDSVEDWTANSEEEDESGDSFLSRFAAWNYSLLRYLLPRIRSVRKQAPASDITTERVSRFRTNNPAECSQKHCLNSNPEFWKFAIIQATSFEAFSMMMHALGNTNDPFQCILRKLRLQATIKRISFYIEQIDLTSMKEQNVIEATKKVDFLMESLKNQWKAFQTGIENKTVDVELGLKCKCTVIWYRDKRGPEFHTVSRILHTTSDDDYLLRDYDGCPLDAEDDRNINRGGCLIS